MYGNYTLLGNRPAEAGGPETGGSSSGICHALKCWVAGVSTLNRIMQRILDCRSQTKVHLRAPTREDVFVVVRPLQRVLDKFRIHQPRVPIGDGG